MKRSDISDAEVLAIVAARPDAYDQLCAKYSPKVAAAKLEHLVDRGLIEYGTSLAYVWLVQVLR